MANAKAQATEQAVLVTTLYRGVFCGYRSAADALTIPADGKVTLTRCRMAVYWSAAMKGVLGLATKGPDNDCRIGDPVEEIELAGVTAIVRVSDAAAERWQAVVWK